MDEKLHNHDKKQREKPEVEYFAEYECLEINLTKNLSTWEKNWGEEPETSNW